MDDFVIRFPRPIAVFYLLFGLPVLVLLTFMCVWMALSLHHLAGEFSIWFLGAGYVIFSAMAVCSCASVLFFFRYSKESLFTTFRFVEQGVNVENKRYQCLMLSWSDIESASYSRSLKAVTLRSPKLVVPIAISQWENFPDAVRLLKQRMGKRWVEKWV